MRVSYVAVGVVAALTGILVGGLIGGIPLVFTPAEFALVQILRHLGG